MINILNKKELNSARENVESNKFVMIWQQCIEPWMIKMKPPANLKCPFSLQVTQLLRVEGQNWRKINQLLSNCADSDCPYAKATKA